MSLSVIITHHQTPELLRLCINSIKKAIINIEAEIIISDSESKGDTLEMLKHDFPEVSVISFKKNVGYAKLVNAGLEKSKGKYILILNADIITKQEAVESMLCCMEKNPEIGILGPQLLNFNGSVQKSCFRFYNPSTILYRRTFLGKTSFGKKDLARFLMDDFDQKTSREVEWLQGAALLVKRKAINRVGLMDERFFMYFEDVDWCRRFFENSWKVVYFPGAQMFHYHGQGSKKKGGLADLFANRYARIHLLSAIKYFLKYY